MNKWYDSLPEHTKIYLRGQPLWHDLDMFKVFALGIFVGVVIGLIV